MQFVGDELGQLDELSLRRFWTTVDSPSGPEVTIEGRRYLQFASNDYLGLANDPRVVRAAVEATRKWGAGTGSARLITGAQRPHEELESQLAALKQTEAALLFSSGYLANIGTIQALAGPQDAIFSDELNHASIIDGCRLSKAKTYVYRHTDTGHLRDLLRANARRKLVVTDTVFSMDGDLAPLPDLVDLCEESGAMLMVDEAHATGVLGRGAVSHFGLEGRVPIIMGTLSKALGAAGGYIAGSRELIEFLTNKARSFIFDTSLPSPVAAAASAAIKILADEPWRSQRVRHNAKKLAEGLGAPDPAGAIVPIVIGQADEALRLSAALRDAGILVVAIRPPSVTDGTSRLRATVMATHNEEHIDRLIDAFLKLRISV